MAGQGPYNPMGGQPPQMQQQPQMGQHSPEMQRQMAMMQARQSRKGTSKAVPIVVSAGLAVGTFCGLLFGLGTGESTAAPSKGNNIKKDGSADEIPAALQTKVNDTPAPKPNPPAAGSGSAVAATAGSGSGSGSAAAPVAKPKLVVELTPDTAASAAHIFVDGKEITGKELEYEVDPATNKAKTPDVVVTVKADGFKDGEQKVKLDGDTTVKFEMVKGKSTLPKDVAAKDAGAGSAAPAAAGSGSATPAVAVTPPKKDPPAAPPPVKHDPPAQVHHDAPTNPPPHKTPPKTPPKKGGLIDI